MQCTRPIHGLMTLMQSVYWGMLGVRKIVPVHANLEDVPAKRVYNYLLCTYRRTLTKVNI